MLEGFLFPSETGSFLLTRKGVAHYIQKNGKAIQNFGLKAGTSLLFSRQFEFFYENPRET